MYAFQYLSKCALYFHRVLTFLNAQVRKCEEEERRQENMGMYKDLATVMFVEVYSAGRRAGGMWC